MLAATVALANNLQIAVADLAVLAVLAVVVAAVAAVASVAAAVVAPRCLKPLSNSKAQVSQLTQDLERRVALLEHVLRPALTRCCQLINC